MKAVLLMRECVLAGKGGELSAEATRTGLRALAELGVFTLLLDPCPEAGAGSAGTAPRQAAAVEAIGGRVDAVVWCPHHGGRECGCWGAYPGLIHEAATRFDLQLNECYLIAHSYADVEMAAAAGVRPILCLGGRTIAEVQGERCAHKDHPAARTFPHAIEYIAAEERAAAQLGRPRLATVPPPGEDVRRPAAGAPAITPLSREALAATRRLKLRPRPREVARWLGLLTLGGVWLSLGIAYLLVHLYRVQPFPDIVWYLTLQFIGREVRGVLFILTGVAVVLLASRSFWHAFGSGPANGAGGGDRR